MYPNLYYLVKDLFGADVEFLKIFNTFGLMVALAFVVAAYTLTLELKRKEKQGLLTPREETITVGKSASVMELLLNFVIGYIFGFKILGLIFSKPEGMNPQDYIFSGEGHILGGIALGLLLAGLKWYDKNKQKLPKPEQRVVRIWPHDRVGDIVVVALLFGILGAKLFDSLEHWDSFIQDPIGQLFSRSGLAFYGGLIVAAFAVSYYGYKRGIKLKHLVDAAAPGLMLAYAIGRIGCQVSGDGDWGIYNSAYISDNKGNLIAAKPGDFEKHLQKDAAYYIKGDAPDSSGRMISVTDRVYGSLENVPRKSWRAPAFLPDWMVAYTYPQNVNADGILIPGNSEEHNRVLPSPVFPTPLFETIVCGLFFVLLWSIRRRIKVPVVLFGIYLVLNGIERFLMETIRVNNKYPFLGLQLSQAEIIALCLVLAGLVTVVVAKLRYKPQQS